jgi:hypothetical protein
MGNPLDNNDELTPETLQKKLQEYSDALKQEYELATDSTDEPKNVEEMTLHYFRKNVPHAVAQIVHLSQNSTSDAVRLNASKYIHQAAFKEEAESGDPIKDLLKQLQGNDKKSPAEPASKDNN